MRHLRLTTEPARVYALGIAVYAVVKAGLAWAGIEVPGEFELAVEGLFAVLVGTDLRNRVTPLQMPRGRRDA